MDSDAAEGSAILSGSRNRTVIKRRNPTAMIRDYDSSAAILNLEEERNFEEKVIEEDTEEMEEVEVKTAVLDFGGDEERD